jgi:hypothetical protein
MTSVSKAPPFGSSAKLVAWALALVGVIRLVDFVFYGRHLEHLVAGPGFLLMAFGMFKNGFVTEDNDKIGRYAAGLGAALAIASLFVPGSA